MSSLTPPRVSHTASPSVYALIPRQPGRDSTARSSSRQRTDLLATLIGLPPPRRTRSARVGLEGRAVDYRERRVQVGGRAVEAGPEFVATAMASSLRSFVDVARGWHVCTVAGPARNVKCLRIRRDDAQVWLSLCGHTREPLGVTDPGQLRARRPRSGAHMIDRRTRVKVERSARGEAALTCPSGLTWRCRHHHTLT